MYCLFAFEFDVVELSDHVSLYIYLYVGLVPEFGSAVALPPSHHHQGGSESYIYVGIEGVGYLNF